MGAEILAPCGSPETLEAALRCGCDAVYLGGVKFSARGKAVNFSEEELRLAVYECHRRGVKVHLAINTIIRDDEIDDCINAISFAAEIGVDALIVQDLAVYTIAHSLFPKLELHASTQMTVHSESGMKTVRELGFSRGVLSRELPLDVIKRLSQLGIETEVFVHGALCMSVSGQCYMSAFIGSRSANRGLCAQACRLPASADGNEAYALSLKDVSLLSHLRELEQAGVSSFKIEGRMKRPEYVAMAVSSCKKAQNGEPYDLSTLETVFSRSGFTDGYYYHKTGREMFGRRTDEDAAAAAKVLPAIHELYRRDEKRSRIKVKLRFVSGEPMSLTLTDENGVSVTACSDLPEAAKTKPWDKDFVKSRLLKFGGTIYEPEGFECELGEGLALSPARLGEIRREAVALLDRARAEANTLTHTKQGELSALAEAPRQTKQTLRIKLRTLSQLKGLDTEGLELVCVPIDLCEKAAELIPAEKLAVTMPRFTFDEEGICKKLRELKKLGITQMLGENIGHFTLAKEEGFTLHTDFTLNIANSYALAQTGRMGAEDCVISPELTAAQIGALRHTNRFGVYAYGRLPLMLTVNCPIKQQLGCEHCTGHITDRTKRQMPVLCSKKHGYTEILNSDTLYTADRLSRFRNADFLLLDFTSETPEEIAEIISAYRNGTSSAKPQNVTFGLYSRGVI